MAKKSKTPVKSSGPAINIGISEKDRAAIAGGLSRLLADTYTLYLTTHNFHWNVTGPMFNTLHAMFMAQYTELWNAVDPIAERIRSLGSPAPGSYAQFGALASIKAAAAAQGTGAGVDQGRRPIIKKKNRTQHLTAGRRRRRRADRRPADTAPDGARANGLDAALAAGRVMSAPRPMGTSVDPPWGCGPGWERPGARPAQEHS